MKVRFAPSPTGLLHVGNARIALANWLLARKHRGHFLLRLDDTDSERSKPEYETAIAEDLRWLGLDWDAMAHQSARRDRYAAAKEQLIATKRLYPCFETEEELAAKRERRRRQGKPPVYDREALRMTREQYDRALANGKAPYWRFQLASRSVSWEDGVLGARSVKLQSISDPVLIRADGTPLYTFCSVVDDLDFAITHVIRGEDHVTNTGIQLDLFEALGGDAQNIRFAHLPLLTDSDGGPLSKRLGSVSLRQLRQDGVEPEALAGYLAALGSSADPVAGMPADLVAGYEIDRVSHSTARFDVRQMLALNKKLLHAMPFARVRERLPAGATEPFWQAVRDNLDLVGEATHWWQVVAGEIAPVEQPGEADFFRAALALLPPEPWDEGSWGAWVAALKEPTGRKGRALFQPLRLALTGEEHGPDLKTLLPLIGRERVARRLAIASGA